MGNLASKLNHYYSKILQKLALKTGGGYGRPTYVILLLTNRCNARCVHCHSWQIKPTDDEMTIEQWKQTLNQLKSWLGPVFLSITGGETFLKKGYLDIVQHATNLGFFVEFLTNGYLMSPESAKDLIGTGVNRIRISLDGSVAEVHNKIRGRADFFPRAVEAFRLLVSEKVRQGKPVQVLSRTTIMSHNVDELPDIVKLGQTLAIDGVEFQALEPIYYSNQLHSADWYVNNPLWIADSSKVRKAIDELRGLKKKGFHVLNSNENLHLIEEYFAAPREFAYKVHSHEYKRTVRRCTAFAGGLQIMPDGGLKMCHGMEPFGTAKKGEVKKAWKERYPCWKFECKYLDATH
jgi:MoaA/NifB/PqqE/SkfB family radical SAM enzyme